MASAQDEDWPAVGVAIRERMSELKISTAELARQTGLSETTIRYIGDPDSRHNKAALVAISAVLRWKHDHLVNILHGQIEKNIRITPPVVAMVERIIRNEIGPLRRQLSELA